MQGLRSSQEDLATLATEMSSMLELIKIIAESKPSDSLIGVTAGLIGLILFLSIAIMNNPTLFIKKSHIQ